MKQDDLLSLLKSMSALHDRTGSTQSALEALNFEYLSLFQLWPDLSPAQRLRMSEISTFYELWSMQADEQTLDHFAVQLEAISGLRRQMAIMRADALS